jgi:hypothetical protein
VKARNRTLDESCIYCDDTGWVELMGTIRTLGVVYERGAAPCKWCEQGEVAFRRNPNCESDFGLEDIYALSPTPGRGHRAIGRELARRLAAVGKEMP